MILYKFRLYHCVLQINVHGTVLCRLGVLFLMADNVTVLGGEVEALVENNQQINVLKDAM